MSTKPKPWYTRRRYWSLAILAVLVYFCLIPSPLRVSPETTGFTTPLLPCGDVDYFGAFEQMYIHKLSPPEHNGKRLLLAALGPRMLERAAMMDTVPWEQLPTHEMSRQWFEEYWLPLCEHMYIDPFARPRFLDNLDYYAFMRREWVANNADENARFSHCETGFKATAALREHLVTTPWTAEEYPAVARWLEERSPVLDLFGVAVRKPNFVAWRQRPECNSPAMVLLPDVQIQRQFGRELGVRVTERLGKGDIDGAWYDVMSMLYLSRKHYINEPFLVINLVGIAIEGMGWDAAKMVLEHGNLTPEHLERFAKDLKALPRRMTLYSELEHYWGYYGLQILQTGSVPISVIIYGHLDRKQHAGFFDELFHFFFDDMGGKSIPRFVFSMPFDRNIAGRRIAEFLQIERQAFSNSMITRQYHENQERLIREKEQKLSNPWRTLLHLPLIRTRSQLLADYMISRTLPALWVAEDALDRVNTQHDLLRIAVALKRYESTHGTYPATLEDLVPAYLEDVPLDPFTGRKTLVYRLNPDEETAVLLHSSQWDESGEDSRRANLYIRLGNNCLN